MIARIAFSFALVLFSSISYARIEESFWVSDPSREILKELSLNDELIIDHVSKNGFELYGPLGTEAYLIQEGIIFKRNPLSVIVKDDGYPSYEEITASLHEIVQSYPQIMKLSSIGKSVEGRELWLVKISDNVDIDEVEPEFKYLSSMHGDEIVGRELMIKFLRDIGENYSKDVKVRNLVNNTEIFIMPSLNPDGSERRRRSNANGKDLNRNFPDLGKGEGNELLGREIETQALMKFQSEHHFSLSANFHGGAVVVNYPWDSTYELHPLDELLKQISTGYASSNGPMINSTEFPGGIVNGAQWYIVKGGMQDWSYYFYNDLQVTIEVSDIKWPNYSQIDQFYDDNRDSLYYFASRVHQGAGVKFDDKNTSGMVNIKKISKEMNVDLGDYGFAGGEFYQILDPGSYQFTVRAPDKEFVIENIIVDEKISANGNYFLID